MSLSSFPFLSILLLQSICYSSESEPDHQFRQSSSIQRLDPTNLDLFFFRSAVSALFRADSLLAPLSPTERIVHRQCEQDADGRLNRLAKCLVVLFNQRDFGANSNGNSKGATDEEMPSWLFALFQAKRWRKPLEKNSDQNNNPSVKKGSTTKIDKNIDQLRKLLIAKKGGSKKMEIARERWRAKQKKRDKRAKEGTMKEAFIKEMEASNQQQQLGKKYPNVQKLRRIERFYRMAEKCSEYIKRKDDGLTRFLQSVQLPFRLSTPSAERSPLFGLAEHQVQGSFDQLSILSPKLLSILPEKKNKGRTNGPLSFGQLANRPQNATTPNWQNSNGSTTIANNDIPLLSPNFLSFHEQQGDFSLPSLLKLAFSNGAETLEWLDLLLQISGASATLDKLFDTLGPSTVAEIERKVHPAVERLEEAEERFRRLRQSHCGKQRTELARKGYTFLTLEQSRMLGLEQNSKEEEEMSDEQMEELLEDDIRAIAEMDERTAQSILATNQKAVNSSGGLRRRHKRFLRNEKFGQMRLLNPYLFANQVQEGAVLRRVEISPKAFSSEILSPDFARSDVLSPGAFVPSILSPRAMIAHILSPTAFTARILSPEAGDAEILSPRAFDATILSPRALVAYILSPKLLITEILSPRTLEFKVLSPPTLAFYVLSPTFFGAHIASPKNYALSVLSPSIMMPEFLNEGVGNVQILSPHIFSDGRK